MSQVETLYALIRQSVQPIEQQVFEHEFFQKLEGKLYSKHQVAFLPKEEFYINASDLRSAEHLMVRFGQSSTRQFFQDLVDGERFALSNVVTLAEALDCQKEELEQYQPDPYAQAYPAYFAWLALHGSEAEVIVALAASFSVWWMNCGRVAKALTGLYGVPAEATAFLTPFNQVPPPDSPLDQFTYGVLERGLNQGVPPETVVRAARLIQSYELFFWDSLARSAADLK
jgi:hypothetical protein